MNQESRSSLPPSAVNRRTPTLRSVDFVSTDPSQDRRLFASRLVKKRQRFRRILRLYATTGVVTLTALAFLFD